MTMIPGIGYESDARLRALIERTVTDVTAEYYDQCDFALFGGHEPEARELGIEAVGAAEPTIVVTDRTRRLGRIRVETTGRDATLFFDNRSWGGNCYANIRVLGHDTVLFFNDIGDAYVALPDVFLRSDGQVLFWGRMASAVGCNVELEGQGRCVVIGDDALISAGVWIRNHDMHAMHDLATGARLSCRRVGMGSIVGAASLLKGALPAMVVAVGTPARVIRRGVSWGRSIVGMTEAERAALGLPQALAAEQQVAP
jgi:acetyltransferase-like isoleucine patch superfamily enzyme